MDRQSTVTRPDPRAESRVSALSREQALAVHAVLERELGADDADRGRFVDAAAAAVEAWPLPGLGERAWLRLLPTRKGPPAVFCAAHPAELTPERERAATRANRQLALVAAAR